MSFTLNCYGKILDLSSPQIMGVLNVTPDSFSDGGRFTDSFRALDHALAMQEHGAAIIDVGGESTRPGATPISEQEEIQRVLPVIERLHMHLRVPISIDTSKPAVMRAAVGAGAAMINDVRALTLPGAVQAAAELEVPVSIMHMQGSPHTMQQQPQYENVVEEVYGYLAERVEALVEAGIAHNRLLIDPGFGFGKNVVHNLLLLRHLDQFAGLGLPVVVGLSRKSMLGKLLHREVHERLAGSITMAVLAAQKGAHVLRVHDVAETADALTLLYLVQSGSLDEMSIA